MARFIGKIETSDYDSVVVDLKHMGTVLSGEQAYTSLLYGGVRDGEFPQSGTVIPHEGKIRDEFLPERITSISIETIDSDGYVTPAAVSSYVSSTTISGITEMIERVVSAALEPYREFLNTSIVPKMEVSISNDVNEYFVRIPYGESYTLSSFTVSLSPTGNIESGTMMTYDILSGDVSGEVEVPQSGEFIVNMSQTFSVTPSNVREWYEIPLSCSMDFSIENLITATVTGSDMVSVMPCHKVYYGSYGDGDNGSGMLTSQEVDGLNGYDPFNPNKRLLMTEFGTKINMTTVDNKYIYICVAEEDFTGLGFKINMGDSIDDINVNDWNDEDDIYSGFLLIKDGDEPYLVEVDNVDYVIFRSGRQSGGNNLSFTVIPCKLSNE